MTRNQGFTLIELMIVIAIIGILASLAIPAYQGFIARAQAVEGFTVTSAMRAELSEQFAMQGGALEDITPSNIPSVNDLTGRYVDNVTLTDTPQLTIMVTFDEGLHAGETLELIPETNANGQITNWRCAGLASPEYLPNACQ